MKMKIARGYTLVELIIVLAFFGMAGTVAVLLFRLLWKLGS